MPQLSIDFGSKRPEAGVERKRFLIGTSGYSFQDWKGTFYPDNLPNRDMLPFYAQHFNVAEINATYYRIPPARTFAGMLAKVHADFEFVVKTHQDMTHTRTADDRAYQAFFESLRPLLEAGRLSAILAQFPWSFRFSAQGCDYIARLRDRLPPVPLVVEFRHQSWVNDEVYNFLQREKIVYCCVDEPQLPGLLPPQEQITSKKIGYVRLHGRNAKHWWQGGPLRYDYSYSQDELKQWAERLARMSEKAAKVFVLFNNCHLGQAAKNALALKILLEESS